ncbi:hypothetical protein CVT24_010506 [Panaeolus cyanescens]|uniref:Arrestin-like N-terminal domain-containing protein n=1 Tax=Panaeolus cyanescens TaxID=181874 RepID=A0A409YLQ2_9AGAR|nr:hypothetical protein CVT24_010506 [Panaeolus cyanescens]
MSTPETRSSSGDTRWSTVVRRSSRIFTSRRWSAITMSTHTSRTSLPMYCEMDPVNTNVEAPAPEIEREPALTSLSLPFYMGREARLGYEKRNSLETIVLRSSLISTPKGDDNAGRLGEEVYTHSQSVRAGKPWVTLHMYTPKSRAPRRPTLPRAYGGQPFEGIVELNTDKAVSIQEIKLTVEGRLILGARSEANSTFLNFSIPLWTNPREVNGKKMNSKKFSGYHAFPFSFTFPTEMNGTLNVRGPLAASASHERIDPFPLTGNSARAISFVSQNANLERESRQANRCNSTSLPPSFLMRGVSVTVQYEINLQISHGIFRAETRITSGITYVPTITPPALPLGLRLAYDLKNTGPSDLDDHGVVVPSPIADPKSWLALPAISLRGAVVDINKPVVATCILYIAKPLSYNRGTHIPLFLSISGDDSRVLNTLCTPLTPRVRLSRKIDHLTQTDQTEGERGAVLNEFGRHTCDMVDMSGKEAKPFFEKVSGWGDPSPAGIVA